MRDVITITLYSRQVSGKPPFSQQLFSEKKNIQNIMNKFTNAADMEEREPPKFILSVNLVPDWNKTNNSYDDQDYLEDKKAFLTELYSQFKELTPTLTIEDFYTAGNLTEDEKAYIHQLHSGGSNADIIKTKAIINNNDNNHLQIDSNSQIYNFHDLYKATFTDESNTMATNANYYMWFNVSANNKVVYTPPKNEFTKFLTQNTRELCKKNALEDKVKDSNAVYEKAFNCALESIEVTKKVLISKEKSTGEYTDKEIYVVKIPSDASLIEKHALRITNNVVVAVNMSWNTKPESELRPDEILANQIIKKFNALPAVQVGDALCNFACFNYLIKKYTAPQLTEHFTKLEEKINNENINLTKSQQEGFVDVVKAIDNLCQFCSNEKADNEIMVEFYNEACKTNPEIIPDLVAIIPLTEKGDALTQRMFGCDRRELKESIRKQAQLPEDKRCYPKASMAENILDNKLDALMSKNNESNELTGPKV